MVGDSNDGINFPHKLLLTNTLIPLAKTVLILLRLKAAIPATDATIHKKIFGLDMHPLDLAKQTTLLVSNEELNDTMKIVWRNSLKNLGYW